MKKIFLSVMLLTFIASACKKDRSGSADEAKTQKVTFKVGGYTQTSLGLSGVSHATTLSTNALTNNADTTVTNHVSSIIYLIFDSKGVMYHRIFQKEGDPSFGQYTDNLPTGTYTVAIIAGDKSLTLNTGASPTLNSMFVTLVNEAFFKKLTLTVGTSDVVNNVTLRRITSYLAVVFTDPIPQGANTVDLRVSPTSYKFYVGAEAPQLTSGVELILPVVPNGKPNQRVGGVLFMNESKPLDVTINVLKTSALFKTINSTDGVEKVYAQRQLHNIIGKENVVTTLTGSMFGGNGTSGNGFKVTIDTAWAAPINKGF